LGVAIERRYQGLESPAKMKLAVAGCPRNCSEALVKDVGLVAVGDRENARWLERTYDFVPRVGLAELRAILVDDRDGVAAELDERMQAAVEAYRDPWLEGREPVTPGQFADALPLMPLPRVPVRTAGESEGPR
jgi:nitrite reductase (NADH) large subunit